MTRINRTTLRRFALPILGAVGVLYGLLYAVTSSHQTTLPDKQLALPPTSNFSQSISGSGLVEANTRNIDVGSDISGIVTEMLVAEGDLVNQGTPLFRLDDRTALAELATAESALQVARTKLAEANVSLADQQDQLNRVEKLKEGVAVTVDRVSRIRFSKQAAASRLNGAKAAVAEAEARLRSAQVGLEKLTVIAPITGRILQRNAQVGEYVQAGKQSAAPLVMGNDTPLHVRVSLDENDLWRFKKEAKATGALRSNRDITFPLTFVRLEPYVVPKTSLTGATSERVDTRVMEVVYRVEAANVPIYIGQQVDVFIDASPAAAPSADPVAAQ